MQPCNLQPGADVGQVGGTLHRSLNIQTATPANIAAQGEPAQLAQGYSAPFHLELQWHLGQ